MSSLLKDLFKDRIIPCVDADGSCAMSTAPHGPTLRSIVEKGFKISPIKIIHYASVHYLGRYRGYGGRLSNAIMDLAHVFPIEANSLLELRKDENFELAGGTSEVLAVGLATALMCRALPADLKFVSRIELTSKRCDFQITRSSDVTVFETRGRQHKSQINSAVSDLQDKKLTHRSSANYLYGVVSVLPRNGENASMHIYDPPADSKPKKMTTKERNKILLNHYLAVAKLSKLETLVRYLEINEEFILLETKLKSMAPPKEMINNRLDFEELPYMEERILSQIAEESGTGVKREKKLHPAHYVQPIQMEFGLKEEILDALYKLDFDKLSQISVSETSDSGDLISFASDGSYLKLNSNG